MKRNTYTYTLGETEINLEFSKIAEQASTSLIARAGDTMVLATATMSENDSSMPFFPLRVDVEERFSAGGKILGSRFMRREGRPSDEATLMARLIDRTIRPLFDQRSRRDTQVVITVLSVDGENPVDAIALVAASAALHCSSIPHGGPFSGVRIAQIDGKMVVNPTRSQYDNKERDFSLVAAGPKGRINMIEFEGNEATEEVVFEALKKGQEEIDKLCAFVEEVHAKEGNEKEEIVIPWISDEAQSLITPLVASMGEGALFGASRKERKAAEDTLKEAATKALVEKEIEEPSNLVGAFIDGELKKMVMSQALDNKRRMDGRSMDVVRDLEAEVGLLPRTHGSSLFLRGSTQSLGTATLGAPGSEQLLENIREGAVKERFMLHYNFPPYSTGSVGPFRSAGRREIGHGALAHKALEAVMPSQEEFPYVVRVVSDILSSNGSSSMASVCAGTLALMDAGVPIKKPVAGIAMGLASDNDRFEVLTDLQGSEDHFGNMDFKVAGTDTGITAIQLDTKIAGLTSEMIEQTLSDAKKARLQILKVITDTISEPRKEMSKYAPVLEQLTISVDKIGTLIGPGGKTINGLVEEYGLEGIDVTDEGIVTISAATGEHLADALKKITALTHEYEVGEIVEGEVVKLLEFGAIVDFGGRDGMIHVSEMSQEFVEKASDIVELGQIVKAKIVRVDNGKIGLSLKRLQDNG